MRQALFAFTLLAVTVLAFMPSYAPLPDAVSFSDILNHFAAFVTLCVLYAAAYPHHPPRRCAFSLLGYGLFIETVQYFLPTRSASAEDLAVDAAAILAARFSLRLYRRLKPAV